MTQTFYQEITGLKLQSEKAEYITPKEYDLLHNNFTDIVSYHNTITKETTLWEFYYHPSELIEEYQCREEQFLISVSTEKENPCITLKKRCNIGDFINERSSIITKTQFRELLLENYNWMKHSSELLILEFYNKLKLWKLKIGILLECARHQIFLKKEKLLITLDRYRAVPETCELKSMSGLFEKMLHHTCRVTVKDIGSNYSGMGCSEILNNLRLSSF